ncbi:MAG: transcriptional regulator NrdR, partial [Candidatus Liptonbacteria bacterium]|nr:transcriptional regulator NrdR [Candidatus Liptonbacteria bacterium]
VLASSVIGQAVMRNLRALDEVAYIRFASVYKDFQTAKGFENEIPKLQKR